MFDNAQIFNSLIPSGSKDAIDYISSITVDEFNALINKPDFFISIADRLIFLNYISLYIENINEDKLKLVIDNIVENDRDIIFNDNIMRKRFLSLIKRDRVSNLLNYFLEIIPNEYVNGILEYLYYYSDFRLDNLAFNDYNKEIIDNYMTKCSNDKLMDIFKHIYNSANDESNWIEFIFRILIKEEKLDLFLEYYKDLINESDNEDKERLVSLLVSLVNVKLEKIDGDEYSLEEFTNNLFDKLGLDNSKEISGNDSKKELSSSSEKIVSYMNDLVGSWLNGTSNIGTKILKSPILIKYILYNKIVIYGRQRIFSIILNEDSKEIDLDDEMVFNLINNFSSSTLIDFFCFGEIDNFNDRILNILKSLLKRYFSYERAIFFVDKIKINEMKKVDIINEVYHDREINDIKQEKENLISRCNEELLSLSDEVSDLFKVLLPELIELPYDSKFFNKLKYCSLDINKLEYLFVYLSQYFKYGCMSRGIDYNEYHLSFIPKYSRTHGYVSNRRDVIIHYKDYSNHDTINMGNDDDDINTTLNVNYIQTSNHERTHLWQDKMSSVISMDALMIGLERNLTCNREYYNSNYYNVYTEIHARIIAFYETYKYLEEINSYMASQYLENNMYLIEYIEETLSEMKEERTRLWNDVVNSGEAASEEEQRNLIELEEEIKKIDWKIANRVTFIRDRKLAKSIEYFANLINTFLERTTKEYIINLRKKLKTLELITDETGRFYDVNEIEERMNFIKSYGTNDIEFNPIDRDTKLFYAKYLHNLRYCLDNGLIDLKSVDKSPVIR